jgi:protein ImuB
VSRASPGAWRDYYVARHENGAECWVFQDAATRWYLHGYFG